LKNKSKIFFILFIGFFSCKGSHTPPEESYKPFQPAELSYINSIKYDCVSEYSLNDTLNCFKSILEQTPYELRYDSLEKIEREKGGINYLRSECYDKYPGKEKMFGVLKKEILRYDSIQSLRVIVYRANKYEDDEMGYWVAISKDRGIKWKYFYTGLTVANFYYLKPKPTLPLFVNDSVIQIESAKVRKITQDPASPFDGPKYELLRDNLVVLINLHKLQKDKDHDGLTDIEEKHLMTNPINSDSDGDGIDDYHDTNPRFENVDSKFSSLVRYLLEGGDHKPKPDKYLVSYADLNKFSSSEISKHIYMVISEDSRIIHLSHAQNTYIFLTENEFKEYQSVIPVPLARITLNIKRVGFFPTKYKIQMGGGFWTEDLIVTKSFNGWVIEIKRSTIS